MATCSSESSSPRPFGKQFEGTPARAVDVSAGFALPPHARVLLPEGVLELGLIAEDATLLAVDGRPRAIWRHVQQSVERRYVSQQVETSRCGPDWYTLPRQIYACDLRLRGRRSDGSREIFQARLWRVREDVTGSYLLRIATAPPDSRLDDRAVEVNDSDAAGMPAPSRRPRPGVGDRIAASSSDFDYRLLADSELVAVYGAGSVTGGLDAVLRVRPGVDPVKLARRYVRQNSGPAPLGERRVNGRREIYLPGGDGGVSAIVVDQPGDARDLLVFVRQND